MAAWRRRPQIPVGVMAAATHTLVSATALDAGKLRGTAGPAGSSHCPNLFDGKGHRLVVLIGDEAYYEKCGFKRIPRGRAIMPGPVDPMRLLLAELAEGAFEGVSGTIQPD